MESGIGFSSIPNSIIQIDGDSSGVLKGRYSLLNIDTGDELDNFTNTYRGNSIFYFEGNSFMVEMHQKGVMVYKNEIFDFGMNSGNYKSMQALNAISGSDSQILILHDKVVFKGDTLYFFEHRSLERPFNDGVENEDYYYPVIFWVVSRKTGIWGETIGVLGKDKTFYRYWQRNGFFDERCFNQYKLKWEKVGLK